MPVTNGRIAFRRFLNADKSMGNIFTINPDGTGLQQVTSSPENTVSTEPSWSADGQWIVYMVAPGGNLDDARLAKIRPDGTDATDLAGACLGACTSDGFPAFAPSGQLIAFERMLDPAEDETDLRAIFVMEADGANARQITQAQASSEHPTRYEDFAPTFAPSGALLAFERRDPDSGLHAIFTVRTGRHRRVPGDSLGPRCVTAGLFAGRRADPVPLERDLRRRGERLACSP